MVVFPNVTVWGEQPSVGVAVKLITGGPTTVIGPNVDVDELQLLDAITEMVYEPPTVYVWLGAIKLVVVTVGVPSPKFQTYELEFCDALLGFTVCGTHPENSASVTLNDADTNLSNTTVSVVVVVQPLAPVATMVTVYVP